MKLSSPEVQHKAAAGVLALGLADEPGVRAAWRSFSAAGTVLVERMAAPGVELLVSVRRDAVVPALVVGLGGSLAEVLDDAVIVPLPVTPERVEAAIRALKGAALLARRRPPGRRPARRPPHRAARPRARRVQPRAGPPRGRRRRRRRRQGDLPMNAIADQLGEVGLPAPVSRARPDQWDAVDRRRRPQRPHLRRLPRQGGAERARPRAPRAARRRLHARAPVRRPRLRRQPLRLRRRPARRPRHPASSSSSSAASTSTSPTRTCGSRSPTAAPSASGSTTTVRSATSTRSRSAPPIRRATGPTSTSSTRSASACAPGRATPGSASRRAEPSSRSSCTASRR